MKKYIKPIVIDEKIQLEDIILSSPADGFGGDLGPGQGGIDFGEWGL